MSIETIRGTLLRSYPYGETSRILRFHTAEGGVLAVIARGVRRATRHGGGDPGLFSAGDLSYVARDDRELQLFRGFQVDLPRTAIGTSPLRLAGASFIAELVLKHGGEGGGQAVHSALEDALSEMEKVNGDRLPTAILHRSWAVVSALGYRPILDRCTRCDAEPEAEVTRFDRRAGGVLCISCSAGSGPDAGPRLGPGARAEVAGLLAEVCPEKVRSPAAHLRLLHDFAAYHGVEPRPLKSFQFLLALMPANPQR